ncbi:hypothetical protein VNO80_04392 [Phaseolus coccineus]|uniref:Uncharacterized protein n=1 Tax=Phaseolus coccineus TaxID=3886 RepID=A0AAN9NU37_PHACN
MFTTVPTSNLILHFQSHREGRIPLNSSDHTEKEIPFENITTEVPVQTSSPRYSNLVSVENITKTRSKLSNMIINMNNHPENMNYSCEMYSYSHFKITSRVLRDLKSNA